jgi:hypothetical protein
MISFVTELTHNNRLTQQQHLSDPLHERCDERLCWRPAGNGIPTQGISAGPEKMTVGNSPHEIPVAIARAVKERTTASIEVWQITGYRSLGADILICRLDGHGDPFSPSSPSLLSLYYSVWSVLGKVCKWLSEKSFSTQLFDEKLRQCLGAWRSRWPMLPQV